MLAAPKQTKQLEADESDADVSVTPEDQTHINRFSRLNSRSDEIEQELESLKKQVEDCEEVETEMELMDEDEQVMCVVCVLVVVTCGAP